MPRYKHPGVYLEEIPNGSKSIERVTTSVTAFVGKATKGPVGKAELIHSFSDYKNLYGDIASKTDTMGLAVQSFYLNGGKSAYICRIAKEGTETVTANEFNEFYDRTLSKIDDVSIVLVPGEFLHKDGSDNSIISVTLAHCEKMKNRMVIIDPPPDLELDQAAAINRLALPTSSYSALYYPWVKITNPFNSAESSYNTDKTFAVAPSSFAAGIWARFDRERSIWKAPAGLEAGVIGAAGLKYKTNNTNQEDLNSIGVNCIRNFPRVGSVIWGSRTLAANADTEWRYVPVRRTAIMIEQSIYQGIQWAVFEPNNQSLWSALRTNVSNFMNSLFREGAFFGMRAADGYFVRCGLGDTMTQSDIDAGKLTIMVGFAPLKPAEFTLLRIQQQVGRPC